MKLLRLVLIAAALSVTAAACSSDATGPDVRPGTVRADSAWTGALGSGN